ncbi:MAG TPA: hypothetical protein VGO57_18115 [Verrucomicrobiae bacterium]
MSTPNNQRPNFFCALQAIWERSKKSLVAVKSGAQPKSDLLIGKPLGQPEKNFHFHRKYSSPVKTGVIMLCQHNQHEEARTLNFNQWEITTVFSRRFAAGKRDVSSGRSAS